MGRRSMIEIVVRVALNRAIDDAATVCFERADRWKMMEQEALNGKKFEDAKKFLNFCNEADDCVMAVRALKNENPGEKEVIGVMIKMCEEESCKTGRPEYSEIRDMLLSLARVVAAERTTNLLRHERVHSDRR